MQLCGNCGVVVAVKGKTNPHKCPRDFTEWDALCSVATVAAAYLDGNLEEKHLRLVLSTLDRVRNSLRTQGPN